MIISTSACIMQTTCARCSCMHARKEQLFSQGGHNIFKWCFPIRVAHDPGAPCFWSLWYFRAKWNRQAFYMHASVRETLFTLSLLSNLVIQNIQSCFKMWQLFHRYFPQPAYIVITSLIILRSPSPIMMWFFQTTLYPLVKRKFWPPQLDTFLHQYIWLMCTNL